MIDDGWSLGSTHYVTIFDRYHQDNNLGYRYNLLGFSPYEDEISLNATVLYDYISYVLSVSESDWCNVTALLGDNCSVNKALARMA